MPIGVLSSYNHDAYAYPLYMVRLYKDSEICLESILIYSFFTFFKDLYCNLCENSA